MHVAYELRPGGQARKVVRREDEIKELMQNAWGVACITVSRGQNRIP